MGGVHKITDLLPQVAIECEGRTDDSDTCCGPSRIVDSIADLIDEIH